MAEPRTVVADAPANGAPPPTAGAPLEPTGQATELTNDAGKAPSPPTDIRALHAGLTRKSQMLSAIRDELGLPKSTPDEQLLDAVRAARRPKLRDIPDDPDLQARYETLIDQQWAYAEKLYGKDVTDAVRRIRDLALTTDDPEAMTAAFWELREAQGTPPPATAPAAPEEPQAEAAAQEQVPPVLEMGDGSVNELGRKPIPTNITEGLKGSGNLKEAARRLFGGSTRA